MSPDLAKQEPYQWARTNAEHLHSEPDCTFIPDLSASFDVLCVDECMAQAELMRLGMLQLMYGDVSLRAQDH